jgi:protein-S-isoprenylcysteine O-methyltransferase Ste14
MTFEQRQLAVGVLLSVVLLVRLIAHHEAGGLFRDQSDGFRQEGGRAVSVVLRLVFFVGGLLGVGIWLATGWSPVPVHVAGWAQWLAVGMTVLGTGLLVWVHIALGLHFSGTLHLRDDHRLVQSGPYAWVRHPMYTSFLLLLGGFSVLVGDVVLAGILLGSQVWVLGFRLPHEEAQLAERFPADWPGYRARTGAVLPRMAKGRA